NYKSTYTFDDFNRVQKVQDPAPMNGITRYGYNPNHQANCIQDQNGKKTGYTYHPTTGNLLEIMDADNTDQNPQITGCQLKADGKTWDLTYTNMNDISTEIDPLDRLTEYGYDVKGNLTSVKRKDTQANGRVTRAL